MPILQSYKELLVWQAARQLTRDVYVICSKLPVAETYGLASQMRRASVSIPGNIAEGYRRNNRKEYIHFLGIAAGSAAELETQLILSNDLYKIDTRMCLSKIGEIQKMLTVMIKKLNLSP